jgi:hypothetical protein
LEAPIYSLIGSRIDFCIFHRRFAIGGVCTTHAAHAARAGKKSPKTAIFLRKRAERRSSRTAVRSSTLDAVYAQDARHVVYACFHFNVRGIICANHRFLSCSTRSMFRLRLQKIGSLLGLLAILMSTFAPTVSQALAAHDRLGEALATYCSADPANSQLAHDSKSSHSPAYHWQACAYCGMLAHVPVLPGTATAFVAELSVARAPVAVTRDAAYIPLFYSAAQPRAPPVLS